ncbi:hypothetical protein CFO_g668 [Ceratocystis platani]|uniref:Uncharacterized protein n=1 Tax=Ceratocystis fimbriata f. sp. platani TaxID=88771 RepID=A0A0F8BWT5_CERFI|nr:hypothetical protein CFO_g668 [Ceratocystis platani]
MPLFPRLQVFEIDDQEWFPPFLRTYVQSALTVSWNTAVPFNHNQAPSQVAAKLLLRYLGPAINKYRFIDFCAGAGGPTPMIEANVNAALDARNQQRVPFVMTDLHPNVWGWTLAVDEANARERQLHGAASESMLGFEKQSVDAGDVPRQLLQRWTADGGKVFRLFNLAFHHFDDELARRILKNTVETSDGFAIFELQKRSISGFVTVLMLGLGTLLLAPIYAIKWRSPAVLFFTYVIPVLPFVIVFDGFMSVIRTRTTEEVELLLRTCGAKDAEDGKWVIENGTEQFVWPFASVNYIMCAPQK